MQIQPAGQDQSAGQMQQTQKRKMDGSGNGQGIHHGSNSTAAATQPTMLDITSTFAVSA